MAVLRRMSLLIVLSLLLTLSVSFLPTTAQVVDPFAPAEIVITDRVIATDVEPLGTNLTTIAGGTNLATNNLIRGSGMEPATVRYLVRVERSGPGWIEWDQSHGGVHMWDQNRTGFGDGAVIRFYRLVDVAGQPLSYGGGQHLNEADDAERVIFLTETTVPPGGWVAEGSEGAVNRVHLEDTETQFAYGDYAMITITQYHIERDEVHPRLLQWYDDSPALLYPWWEGGRAEIVPHTAALPADFTEPGDGCIQLTAEGGFTWFGQYLFHGVDGGEGQWYAQLEPGVPYRAEVWLRQEGLSDGRVWFYLGGAYDGVIDPEPWQVTGEWQRFTYDFVGPPYPGADRSHGAIGLAMESAGTVWADNFVVYRNDARHDYRPFTPHQIAFDELMAAMPSTGPKPSVRFYGTTYHTHSPMDRLLSNYASSNLNFIHNLQPAVPVTVPHALEWALATGSSPEDRVVPYFTLSEEYTEVEWLQLVEYLGVPYDPTVDTPEARPWAYRRYQQRGIGTPWTDEFREIVLEFGNETWHNGAFGGWDGFGAPNWVFFGGREYGLFAHYYFVEHVTAQPWWSTYNLAEKITFALGAGYDADPDAYGELAAQQVPELSIYLGHANYVGPKWETEEQGFEVFDDYGMQETLIGGYLTMLPLIAEVGQTRTMLTEAGLADYRPFAYEGGPSGYHIPGTASEEQVQVAEQYGKSLGMAVSALDAWLYSSQNGYGYQNLWGFAGGRYWSSHTMPMMGGFRRHAGWLALMMRNLYAPGNTMLETTFASLPSYDRQGERIPLMSAYTLRDADTLSVFVLSRKLDDGDFGEGITPVTLNLPIDRCTAVTRYALTAPDGSPADPRTSNIDAENIAITALTLDPAVCDGGVLRIDSETGGVSGGMPPGTVYLYVFETAATP